MLRQELVPAFSSLAFDLAISTTKNPAFNAEPLKTEFGYHVIMVSEFSEKFPLHAMRPLCFGRLKGQSEKKVSALTIPYIVHLHHIVTCMNAK